ncbi:acyltransferase [Bacillus sp. FJAT-27251]|uniref:acyltransferase n=1 Tax=Bacillus sp. FJAT-27251 TaxID=1684142 RepID=UPI0006A7A0A0|nr:acyltransferase [Bacillus sp. FJAT-27251]
MERNYAIDFIKFFAILAVVVIHTFPQDNQLGYFIIDNFSRFAVPFFFAASGYLFGLKVVSHPDSLEYYKRYITKILKIYASWLLFYFSYDLIAIFIKGENIQQYLQGFTAANLLYYGKGTSGYQLWFVIALAWSITVLYLFFRLRKIELLLAIALCLNIAGLFGQSYSLFYELPLPTRDAAFIGLFYSAAGFWFAYSGINRHFSKKTYLYLYFFFSALQAAEGYMLEKVLAASHGEYFLSTIFLTISLFLFAVNHPELGRRLGITKIGGNALGIYAIHVFFIDMIDIVVAKLGYEHATLNIWWNMADAFLVFTLSYAAYQLLQAAKIRLRG